MGLCSQYSIHPFNFKIKTQQSRTELSKIPCITHEFDGTPLDYGRSILCYWTDSASHCNYYEVFIFNSSFQGCNSCIIILSLQKQNFELSKRRKYIEIVRRTKSV